MIFLGSQSFPDYGLARFFKFAKDLNFDGVEICINQNFDTQNSKYLKQLIQRNGIEVKAFSLSNISSENFIEPFEKIIGEFPGSVVNIASPEIFSFKYKNWVENTLPRIAKKYRLKVNYKNSPFKTILGIFPSRSQSSLYDLREKGDVSLDLPALWKSNEEIMRASSYLSEKLQHVYLGNVHNDNMYMPPQTGILPVESFLMKLARENFRGDFTLKISPENMNAGNDEKMMKILQESKQFYDKYFNKNAV